MSRFAMWLAVAGCVGLVAGGGPGCSPPPPSEEAILYYLGNTRYQGQVRRAWPEGQAYLDEVMKHWTALNKKRLLLDEVTTVESLWILDDPCWQDRKALEKHTEDLEKRLNAPHELLAEGDDLREVDKLSRAELMDALATALEDVPEGLSFVDAAGRLDFIRRAWEELADSPEALRESVGYAEKQVEDRLDLYHLALASADAFDTKQPGLHLADAAVQEQAEVLHETLRQAFEGDREAFFEYARERLTKLGMLLRDIDKRRERWEYEHLTCERDYLRNGLLGFAKDLRDEANTITKDLKGLRKKRNEATGDEKAMLEARIGFSRQRIEQLEVEAKKFDGRVQKIFAQTDQITAEPDGSGED